MNKLIMAFSLLITPFFLHGSIFEDGSVIFKSPKSEAVKLYNCLNYQDTGTITTIAEHGDCVGQLTAGFEARLAAIEASNNHRNYSGSIVIDDIYASFNYTFDYVKCYSDGSCEVTAQRAGQLAGSFISFLRDDLTQKCPPDDAPTFTGTYGSGETIKCYDPAQVSNVDTCNANSGSEFLDIPVTSGSGCFTQTDGSSCKYDAVTSDSGVQFYAMDLEGDCYSENTLPDLNGMEGQPSPTPNETPSNENDTCKEWGGTGLVCPEQKADVCDDNGTCPESCGTVNGVFVCIDNDIDGDDIPDYLDPDVDGDGIPNGDDLDSNGDGKDDPIDNTGQGNGSGGGTTVEIDMGPVVAELKELNKTTDDLKKSLTETDVVRQTEPSPDLVGFYESVYDDGVEGMFESKVDDFKATEFYTFLDQFKPRFGGSPPPMQFCFNFGTYMNLGCFSLVLDPRIFPAMKIFILVTAGFTCRKILFGG